MCTAILANNNLSPPHPQVLALRRPNWDIVTFSHVGVKDGLSLTGSLRGVLPIGPNGVDVLDALEPSPLTNAQEESTNIIRYNYNLELQGIASNISCSYDTKSPVRIYSSDEDITLQFNGTCPGKADVFTNGKTFTELKSANNLAFWACKTPGGTQEPSYIFYLRGYHDYAKAIGNITCTSSPIRSAVYSVSYLSGVFYPNKEPSVVFGSLFPGFTEQVADTLGQLIANAQMPQTNLFGESVITLGVKYFGLTANEQQPHYPPLYASMIQGVLEYEVICVNYFFAGIISNCIN